MKKLVLILSSSLFIIASACKNNTSKETVSESDEIQMEEIHAHDEHAEHNTSADEELAVLDNSWTKEIVKDSGKRWNANPETNEGVENMLQLIKETKTETLEEYHQLAAELNEQKNYVVKECTMEGPSHDNLHVFLHPLIDKINALLVVEDLQEAQTLKENTKQNLEKYYDYFK